MTVSQNSRYFLAEQRKITSSRGAVTAVFPSPYKAQVLNYTVVVVPVGQSVESLASRLYNDPTKWWLVANVNPNVKFPLDLRPGTILRLPQ